MTKYEHYHMLLCLSLSLSSPGVGQPGMKPPAEGGLRRHEVRLCGLEQTQSYSSPPSSSVPLCLLFRPSPLDLSSVLCVSAVIPVLP